MRDGMAEGNKGLKPLANKMRRQQRAADYVGDKAETQSGDAKCLMVIAGIRDTYYPVFRLLKDHYVSGVHIGSRKILLGIRRLSATCSSVSFM